jgi:AraC family transcriptional regulator of adaptative response / DNA-3-methyladenine glycosylase II
LSFLLSRGAAGVECAQGQRYVRTARLDEHSGWFSAEPVPGQHALRIEVSYGLMPVLAPLLARVRHLFDLNANPRIIEEHLRRDARLKPLVRRQAGLRVPGAFDGFELALRAVLGQQVTVAGASTLFGRFASAFGEPAATPYEELTFFAPTAEAIAAADLRAVSALGLPAKRAETVLALARAAASGDLELAPGADVEDTMRRLQAIPGIGAWTAHYVAMRALGFADAFPHSDLGLIKALGLRRDSEIIAAAEPWRPWRAYAAHHLWASLK